LTVVCVSKDLPFALSRFCGAEGIENVTSASAFRDSFGEDYGVTIVAGPRAGLLARAVGVVGADGTVTYTELVPEIAAEPDYDAALAAAG
jgi:thiol peroxidase